MTTPVRPRPVGREACGLRSRPTSSLRFCRGLDEVSMPGSQREFSRCFSGQVIHFEINRHAKARNGPQKACDVAVRSKALHVAGPSGTDTPARRPGGESLRATRPARCVTSYHGAFIFPRIRSLRTSRLNEIIESLKPQATSWIFRRSALILRIARASPASVDPSPYS